MNVLEPKYLDTKTNFMYDVFKFGSYPVRLVGTGSMLSQDYPADFDFLCQVPKIFPADYVSKQFEKIFDRMLARPELFFIEFKLQKKLKKGEKEAKKYKVFKTEDVNYDFFEAYYDDSVELCKIDAIIYLEGNIFKEVSCIYFFGKVELDMKKYIQALLDDQKHYYDAGKYYKSLKRLMLASKYENPPDTNLIVLITRFFNSAVGKAYAIDNQISACEIYKERYKDSQAHLRVKLFIKAIGLGDTPADKLGEVSKEYQKLYNGEALKLYKKYKLPVGHLPAWGTIKGGAKKKAPKGFHIMPDGKLMKDSEHKVGGAPPNDVNVNDLLQRFLRRHYVRLQQEGLNFQQLYSLFLRFNEGELPLVELRERMPLERFIDEVNNYVAQLFNEQNDAQADYYNREGAGKKSKKKVGGINEPEPIEEFNLRPNQAPYGNEQNELIYYDEILRAFLNEHYRDKPVTRDILNKYLDLFHTPLEKRRVRELLPQFFTRTMREFLQGGKKPKKKVGGIIEPVIRPIAEDWFRKTYGNVPSNLLPDLGFIADLFVDYIQELVSHDEGVHTQGYSQEIIDASALLDVNDWQDIIENIDKGYSGDGKPKKSKKKVGGYNINTNLIGWLTH